MPDQDTPSSDTSQVPRITPVDIRLEPDGSTVTVRGTIDRRSGHGMRTFLESTDLRSVPEVTIDLSGVEMLLASGLRELAEGFRYVRDGGSLVVVHAPDGTVAGRVIDVLRRIDAREHDGIHGGNGVDPLPPAA
ncbi:STAS domain-containing protein [Nocardioides zeae]